MEAITRIQSRTVVLPTRDIDTDQIIPARYLTTTSREGLGKFLFHDLRFNKNGEKDESFVLNTAQAQGCEILIGGNNFGCGSSREHAPWALLDAGFRAVISTKIADIFRNNSLKNGLVPIVIDEKNHRFLLQNPGIELDIDVRESTLTLPDGVVVEFSIDAFARYCLVDGIDQLGYLRKKLVDIEDYERTRSWTP